MEKYIVPGGLSASDPAQVNYLHQAPPIRKKIKKFSVKL